jgi:hypothetical protein
VPGTPKAKTWPSSSSNSGRRYSCERR